MPSNIKGKSGLFSLFRFEVLISFMVENSRSQQALSNERHKASWKTGIMFSLQKIVQNTLYSFLIFTLQNFFALIFWTSPKFSRSPNFGAAPKFLGAKIRSPNLGPMGPQKKTLPLSKYLESEKNEKVNI